MCSDNCILNWTISEAALVMIRAVKCADSSLYRPELQVVMKDNGDEADSVGVILKLDKHYNSVRELVMRVTFWADTMWNRVDRFITVVDEHGNTESIIDIEEAFGVELAEKELHELKRTNMNAIH